MYLTAHRPRPAFGNAPTWDWVVPPPATRLRRLLRYVGGHDYYDARFLLAAAIAMLAAPAAADSVYGNPYVTFGSIVAVALVTGTLLRLSTVLDRGTRRVVKLTHDAVLAYLDAARALNQLEAGPQGAQLARHIADERAALNALVNILDEATPTSPGRNGPTRAARAAEAELLARAATILETRDAIAAQVRAEAEWTNGAAAPARTTRELAQERAERATAAALDAVPVSFLPQVLHEATLRTSALRELTDAERS